ncbi:amino acid adenylation domain-containing protein [Micromonospora sp. DR5-3]|uniref:amino acid adenylation domain-containing protein n=1 Tax=unclassified Micromonospora TaxID=2617518 RepID=UPI0011D8F208|nr:MULTISPECIES: amino acid adenylation domain-containing protein [unclassified Micromonospora]MCW3818300.1 amino acid adenylation domain-containing protein [Micromonospora sp. DR5-3]TYC21175.1 amino acid adenylation domain-containing protein [Micromonospora sp. MP36]
MTAPVLAPGAPVHLLVRRRAEAAPEATAISWGDDAVSARDLDRHAARIAAALTGFAGRPIAVRVPPGPDRYAALLGVLRAGAFLLWSGTGAAGERGRAILDAVRPAAVLTGGTGDELSDWHTERTGVPQIDVTALPDVTSTEPSVPPEAWAYLAHTSGSTGRPKGVPQTHAALAQFSNWFATEFGLAPGVRMAQWVAPDHDPALCETFATLVAGAVLCPVPDPVRAHPGRLLAWLAAERIDVLQTVPSFARQLLTESTERSRVPLALRRLLLMGEAVPESLVQGFQAAAPGMALANIYGPTETVAATWYQIPPASRGVVPIGRPIPGRDVLLLDELDLECPPGVVGEIVVRSPYVTPGYLGHEPGDPAFRAVPGRGPGPWYRTGDLGLRRDDGLLEFHGRRDQQVKIQGHRLELAEIESVLLEHGSIAECAVLAVTGADGIVTKLAAYVVPRDGPSPAHWRAHMRQRFGDVMLPMVFRVVPRALPRNETGKVDRRLLAELGQQPTPPADGQDSSSGDASQ